MFSFTTAIILFVTYVLIDMLYAAYILYVSRLQAVKAGLCSMVIYSLLAFGVISYSSNVLYLIPLSLGAFLGTYLTVCYEARKKAK